MVIWSPQCLCGTYPSNLPTQHSLLLERHRGREGWMPCGGSEAICNKRHSSRNGPMRGRTRWRDSGSIANRALCGLCGHPPSPAMRWSSVLGNLGDGGGGWSSSWQKLVDDRISAADENEGFLSGDCGSVGSQTTTRDPGRRVDSCDESSSRQYRRRAIAVPSTIIIDNRICAAVEDGVAS